MDEELLKLLKELMNGINDDYREKSKTLICPATSDEIEQQASFFARKESIKKRNRALTKEIESLQADVAAFWMKVRIRLKDDGDFYHLQISNEGIYKVE